MTVTDAQLAIAAAQAGAEVVKAFYGTPIDHFAKSHRDFATTADLEAEQAILAVIRAHRPEDAFVGEESGHSGPAGPRTWLVDPLCGTLNCHAAGCVVTGIQGQPLHTGVGGLLVTADAETHATLLRVAAKVSQTPQRP